jgi:3-methyladenine DNA glycosylase AlkD
MVVEAEIFPAVLTCLKDPDEYVKKNVATLIREIAKHTPEVGNYCLFVCLMVFNATFNNISVKS